MIKILNLKLVILLEYQYIKTFSQKAMFQVGVNKFLWLKNAPWTYIISNFNEQEIVEIKSNQKEFRVENVIKKVDNLNVKWKDYESTFNSWIDKRDLV